MVKLERIGPIAVLRLDNQAELNALSSAMINAINAALDELSADKSLRALIITGEGKAFCAGASIAEMKDANPIEAKAFAGLGCALMDRVEAWPVPVIAAINGFALGGGLELALACDIRLAGERAKFAFPETGLGIMPGFGGTQRLPRLIGAARAKELIFTGDRISAEQALAIGLVSKTVPQEELMVDALALAGRIAKNAPAGVRQAKAAINCGLGTAFENEAFALCFATIGQKEAMAAFMEKREFGGFKDE